MDERDPILDGRTMERILADPLVDACFTRLLERYGSQWSTARSVEEREALWQKQAAVRAVKAEMQGVVDAGVMASRRA